jgi:hypothetical protein
MDLPTPPLPLTTPITFLIWLKSWGFSWKLALGFFLDAQSAWHEEQSDVQLSGIAEASFRQNLQTAR